MQLFFLPFFFFPVVRNSAFNLGSEVNLTCSNKTWNEMMFVTWTITLKNKHCSIGYSNEGRSDDLCKDGKSLRNTSSAQSYLHISNFSNNDVGVYNCESVYTGGNDNYRIHVDIKGRTFLLTRIDDFKVINKVNFLKARFAHVTH